MVKMEPQKNKGLEDFIDQAMNVDDGFIQRGVIHGDPKGVIIIDEFDNVNPEQVAALLNLNGKTIHLEGTVDEKAEQLLDMFKKLDDK